MFDKARKVERHSNFNCKHWCNSIFAELEKFMCTTVPHALMLTGCKTLKVCTEGQRRWSYVNIINWVLASVSVSVWISLG